MVLLLAVAIVVHVQMEPTRLAGNVLSRLGPTLGLELTFDGEPEYSLSPEPRLVLPNFSARQPGATVPLLTAKRAEVSLPWDTITGGDTRDITRVELQSPVLDLAALSAWRASRPDTPFELPTLTRGLEVGDGKVVAAGWSISALDVSLPELRAGEPADADIAGRFVRGTTEVAFDGELSLARAGLVSPLEMVLAGTLSAGDVKDVPWKMELRGELDMASTPARLSAVDLRAGGSIRAGGDDVPWTLAADAEATFGDTTMLTLTDATFDSTSPLPDLHFDGFLSLDDELHAGLGGAIPAWPEGWPTLPAPLADPRPIAFALNYTGAADLGDPLRLRLTRDGTRLVSRLRLPEVLAWMDREGASPLPPITGTLVTPAIVIGGFTLDGVRITFDDGDDDGDGVAAHGPFANVRSTVVSTEDGAEATP